jgi:hypothetical protein
LNPSINRTPPGRTGKWTEDEDSKLEDAVQTHGGKDWGIIAVLVPDRTGKQCRSRWSIDRANASTCKWTEDEDSKLKDAVQTHGGKSKNWEAITALVPGRSEKQCHYRWKYVLDPSIDWANRNTYKSTAVEDSQLKDAVQTHGGKNWVAIAALVPGRRRQQCHNRWKAALDPSIDRTPPGRTGKWTEDEIIKLKDVMQTHGGKSWGAIAALVPGRAEKQCSSRWQSLRGSHNQE